MCLSYPARVISVDGQMATVRGEHRDFRASAIVVPDVAPGDYVIVAAGTILERLDPGEAAEISALLDTAHGTASAFPGQEAPHP